MRVKRRILACTSWLALLLVGFGPVAAAEPPAAGSLSQPMQVTADNFIRAESDMYFGVFVKRGALGKFVHFRDLAPVGTKSVRPNRDTLYSQVVFDLGAGPVTITLPDARERFMSMMVLDEDHYTVTVAYDPGTYTFDRKQAGTRYIFVAVRTLIDPANAQDVAQGHALQDALQVSQPGGPGRFEVPAWDAASQKKVRDLLKGLGESLPDMRRAFGARGSDQVDPVRRLIGVASAWGGNPDKDAIYLNVTPARNDGTVIHSMKVPASVPVDGFWSISVYDAEGFFQRNKQEAYTLNSITAKRGADGSVAVQFGGCDGSVANCLPVMNGWNYMVRLYRPREEILSGKWTFPEARP
jgi:hypothetical protein